MIQSDEFDKETMYPVQHIAILSRRAIMALALGMLVWTGCDSNEDEDDSGDGDAAILVGTWNAVSILAGPIEVLNIIDLSMSITLEAGGDAEIAASDENGPIGGVTGTYTIDDQAKTITLDVDDVDDDLVLAYELIDDDTVSVEFSGSDLLDLGIDLGEVGNLLEGVPIDVRLERATN